MAESKEYETFLGQYVEALGGEANLSELRSVYLKGVIQYPDGDKAGITILKKPPNKVRTIVEKPTHRIIQAYDGSVAWYALEKGKQSSIHRMQDDIAANFIREAPVLPVLLGQKDSGTTFEFGEEIHVALSKCYQLIARHPDGAKTVYFVEKESFIDRRIVYYNTSGEVIQEIIPSDFERFGGILFSKRIVVIKDGKPQSTLVIKEIKLNVGALDSVFAPPQPLLED
jgi:outer membrane lipoprotein-sorting protein